MANPLGRLTPWIGIRGKLIALVAILLIPVFVLNGVGVYMQYENRVRHEFEESEALAGAISTSLVNYLESLWDMEYAVGTDIVSQPNPDMAAVEQRLQEFVKEMPTVTTLYFIDLDGIVRASALRSGRGTDVKGRDYYERIIAGEEKVVSNLVVGRATGTPTVAVARAIRRNGELLGIMAAGIDLTRLADVLPVASVSGRRYGFVDRSGMVVYFSDNPQLPMEQRMTKPNAPSRRSLQGETVWIRSFVNTPSEGPQMSVSVPVKPIGWAFFTAIPYGVLMKEIWAYTIRDAVVLLLITATSLVLALAIARGMIRPIVALQRTARAISAGDLGARVGLSGGDEVAAAAQTFDSMASRMQLADEVLKARLTSVAHLSQQAVAGADLGALTDSASALVALSLGVEAAAVLEIFPHIRKYRVYSTVGLVDDREGRTLGTGYDHMAAAMERRDATVWEDLSDVMGFDVSVGNKRIVSAAMAPIAGQERPFGALAVMSTGTRKFSPSDLHFLQAVANVLATAVDRQRAEKAQAFLVKAGNVLAGSLDTASTMESVAQLVTESLADWCIVDLWNGDEPMQIVSTSHPEGSHAAEVLRRLIATGSPGWNAARERLSTGEPIYRPTISDEVLRGVSGADEELLAVLRSMKLVSSVVVPLVARGKVFGLISCMTSAPAGYDGRDQHLVQELARRAAMAVDHAQMYREATQALAERDRALANAERERSRLHTLFEQAPAIIAIHQGPEHLLTLANPAYCQMFDNRPLVGRRLLDALPELVGQGFPQLLDQVRTTGIPYEGKEVRAMLRRTPDGPLEETYFNFVYQPMLGAAGEPDAVFAFAVDVTEQVRARRQVEALANDLRAVARQQAAIAALGQRLIGGASVETVLTEAVALVNRTLGVDACRVLQLQADGRHFRVRAGHDWTGSDVVPVQTEPGALTLAGYTIYAEKPVIIVDLRRETRFTAWEKLREVGVTSCVGVKIAVDREPYGVLAVHSLTHRSFTEDDVNFLLSVAHVLAQALQHEHDRQRLSTQHAVARILAEGAGEATVGPQILRALGEGLAWDVCLFWKIDREAGRARRTDTWQAEGVNAGAFLDWTTGPRRGEGLVGMAWERAQPLWFTDTAKEPRFLRAKEAAVAGLHGALLIPVLFGDEVLGVIECFSREIRRPDPAVIDMATTIGNQVGQFILRQRAESALRDLNAELEERVQERTAELRVANQELEAFAYSVSHDLRAPLRTIDGFGQALVEDYGDLVGEEGRDFIRRIRGATKNMAGLIDDILRLSRVMRQEIRKERVDLSAMARSVVTDLQAEHPHRAVQVTIAENLSAWGDERLLRLVLQNLLANAWKFTARTPQPWVTLGSTRQGGKSVFYVRDNGAGFDMAYVDKLFVPFQRLHAASEFEGNGIGLATVQRIIQRHGGRVWAESELGNGATIYFTL